MSTRRRSWQTLCVTLAMLASGGVSSARQHAVPPARAPSQTLSRALSPAGREAQIRLLLEHGDTLVESGAYRDAATEYTRALAALDRASPASTPAIVDALSRLGRAWTLAEHLDAAASALVRALPLAEGLAHQRPAVLATVLERLGIVRFKQNQLKPAREVLERALSIRETTTPDDPALVGTLNAFGDLRWFEGKIGDAEGWYRQALALAEQRLPPGHQAIATSLKNVGSTLAAQGDLRGARQLRTRALSIAEGALGADHPELVSYLNDLANSLRFDGDFTEARHLYERALANTERNFGAAHVWTATLVHNIALLTEALGETEDAIRLEQRALATWRRELGPRHPNVARALSGLGAMLAEDGQDRLAVSTYLRALSIREETLKPTHREVARTLTAVAPILLRLGEDDRAHRFLTRAIAIWELDGTTDRDAARAFAVLGQWQLRHAQFTEARDTLERALQMQERVFGPAHVEVARVRADLGTARWALGDASGALEDALQAEAGPRAHLRITIRDLAERTALGYASGRPPGLDLALSILAEPETETEKETAPRDVDAERVFDQLIQSRAVVLDEMAARQRALTNAEPALAGLNASLAKARQRYANLAVRGPESLTVDQYRMVLTQAREEKEDAERALGEKSARFSAELTQSAATLDGVRAALPPDAALVAFVRYERSPVPSVSRLQPSGRVRTATTGAYIAFVLRHEACGVAAIRLGDAASLEALVGRWHEEITGGALRGGRSLASAERAYRRMGEALRQRIWDPLRSHLGDARRVFIVPDGTITNVSFAALPVGDVAYLVDQEPILHYLSAERDLMRPDSAGPPTGRGLLAIGDPAFGARAPQATVSAQQQPFPRTRSACGTLQTMQFSRLPASRTEATAIAALWTDAMHARGDADAGDAHLLSGRAASERTFKSDAPGQRVLHLATHGFFLGDACEPVSDASLRGIGGMAAAKTPVVNVHDKNPLMLSGLALAGANHRIASRGDDDDGILTAEEVAGLDLSGVEWAVLSACDTGIGEVKNGEGVLGLRRGLHVAGVRTVIMSLWAVEDRATLEWMRALYTGRFTHALDTATAVRQASLSVLEARRQKGLHTHPFFWAGFVAVGDWH